MFENIGGNNFMRSPKVSTNYISTGNYQPEFNTNNTNNVNSPLYEVSGNMSEFGFLKNF